MNIRLVSAIRRDAVSAARDPHNFSTYRGAVMKMVRSAISGAALSLVATAASAALVTETYTGTVTGVDHAGFFGTANASLNTSFTAQYFYDTLLGSSANSTGVFRQTGAALGANLIINGITYSMDASVFSLIQADNSTNTSSGSPPWKFVAWTERLIRHRATARSWPIL